MRNRIKTSFENGKPELGQIDIPNIKLDLKSRDQIPKMLLGLQNLYMDKNTLEEVFKILETEVILNRGIQVENGRPGMDLWQILVMGTLRLNNNWDYDHLENMVNSHNEIRLMLGLGIWDNDSKFKRKTLINNFSLIPYQAFDQISELVVKAGHRFLGVDEEELKTRVDSFVMEANVHHPTDSNLLMDSVRKIFHVIWFLETFFGSEIIDQSKNELKIVKGLFTKIRKMRRSNSKKDKVKERRNIAIKEAHYTFLEKIQKLLFKVKRAFDNISIEIFEESEIIWKLTELSSYIDYADYHIDLISRRVLQGETIPQCDKIYSIFEYYTQWISKGKAKAPVELGLRVAVMDDQYGFILNSQVMFQTIEEQMETQDIDEITRKQITDEKIAIPFTKEALKKFANIRSISFDKGFHSPDNQTEIKELIKDVILPKKGKLSKKDKVSHAADIFVKGRVRHSGIESSIHALENHGLDMCPDKGLPAFRRYVSCAVLARNLQVLGDHIQKKYSKKKAA